MKSAIETIQDDGYKMFKNGKDGYKTQFGAGMLYALTLLKAEQREQEMKKATDGEPEIDISDEIIEINNRRNIQKNFVAHHKEMHTDCFMKIPINKIEMLAVHFKSQIKISSESNDYFVISDDPNIQTFVNGV